ncbi:Actin-related protein 5 [Rhodotorula toruloides]|uniref:Putative chromatin remodeling complex subunit Arp5 n=1 Tax=Rhodotorula toruloides TaxID=5286 RepID=A0A2T0A827_RHOTO|nr:Actin-related protein 5 [Rhodotorula toruloides]PRQ74182.1 putative chromatin remodeling complex subunit Arp5 [Rhodotorula toruloides]
MQSSPKVLSPGQPARPHRTVCPVPELQPVLPGPPTSTDYASFASPSNVLCIDNGATTLRAGWGAERDPRIVVENVASKYRDRKFNQPVVLAGGEVYVDATSRAHVRTPFEGDTVCNFDVMENMLDYVMLKLGVDTETLQNPVAMTETLCNPAYSRSLMTELLFESYSAPAISYGVDSLLSLYAKSPNPPTADALVISSSTASTHVIPVLGGRGILTSAKKLNWGGAQSAEYLLKLMQLKYPAFPGRLTSYQSSIIYREHCYHALPSYASVLADLAASPHNLVAQDRIIQFPFIPTTANEQTEEDLERQKRKREEATQRLRETAAKQRQEKLERQQEEMIAFTELRDARATSSKPDYERRLKDAGFSSTSDLEEYLKKLDKSLTRARNKELGIEEQENKEAPSFPLIDVPDHQLNEEDLKEKRRQKLMKAGYDARIRLKAEKEEERRRVEEERRRDEELRTNDFPRWLEGLRKQHEDILEKIKERRKLKEQLADRKSLAAQNRMKSIAGLAADEKAGKKRKRNDQDDGFGRSDADWAIYREIGTGDDSEDEEDEQEALKTVEARLLEHDPNFTLDDTAQRQAMRKSQLINAFVHGLAPDDPLDTYDPENVEHTSQLHVNVERVRVPEVIWQPHMAGLDQAGLTEVVEHVLKGFSESERRRLTQNIFVTGGNTLVPNFDARLRLSLQPSLPVGHPLNIVRPYDVHLDAWRGLSKWSASSLGRKAFVSRAEYDEKGANWFKGHGWGNI